MAANFGDSLGDPVVRAALEEAGWTPGRSVDTQRWVDALEADGYTVVEAAVVLLQALGGLSISPPHRDSAVYGSGTITLDPIWAASGEAERIREREVVVGQALTPVGEWIGELILLVAEDGQMFAETSFQLLRLGRDLESALVCLIVADTAPVLVEPL